MHLYVNCYPQTSVPFEYIVSFFYVIMFLFYFASTYNLLLCKIIPYFIVFQVSIMRQLFFILSELLDIIASSFIIGDIQSDITRRSFLLGHKSSTSKACTLFLIPFSNVAFSEARTAYYFYLSSKFMVVNDL